MISFILKSSLKLSLQFVFWTVLFSLPFKGERVFEQANRLVTKNSYYNLLEEKIEELVFTTVDSAKKQLAKLPRKENSSEF